MRRDYSSETLVVAALLVEVLQARDNLGEGVEPLVELLVELVGRHGRTPGRICSELRVEVRTVRACLHRDLRCTEFHDGRSARFRGSM